jgi:hypothetical protein
VGGEVLSLSSAEGILYLLVEREVDGETVVYLEKIGVDYDEVDLATALPIYLDCATTFEDPGSEVLDGLDHLEGETVYAVADGNYLGSYEVSGGEIEVDSDSYSNVVVGLPFSATVRTLPINSGSVYGNSAGKLKRVDKLTALLYRTRGLKCGERVDNLLEIPFDTTTVLYTGEKEIHPNQSPSNRGQLYLVSDVPYPCNISSLFLRGMAYD